MKKIFVMTIIAILAMSVTAEAATVKTTTTTATAAVSEVFSIAIATGAAAANMRTASGNFTFETATGLKESGWYYNNAVTTWNATGDPADGKNDVTLVCKTNTPAYNLKIKQSVAAFNGSIGYNVGGAFDGAAAAANTPATVTVNYPSGFKGSLGAGNQGWGSLTTTDTPVFTGSNPYPQGIVVPLCYVFVPTYMGTTAPTTLTITYTFSPNL